MTRLSYEVVDVFGEAPFTGNPLAVVFGADELPDESMQLIAREFNLSETTFPVATSTDGADYRLRIFTPGEELPFAGHPSVGSAWLMAQRGAVGLGRVVQETPAGLQELEVTADGATLTGGEPSYGPELDPKPLMHALGLDLADHDAALGPPRSTGCGLNQIKVPVYEDAITRVAPDPGAITAVHEDRSILVFAWGAESRTAHARMFAPALGVFEDPATGSAALGLGVWLGVSGVVPGDATTSYVVRQGLEIGRPSRLECTVTVSGGEVKSATVAGAVHRVARGEIEVP